MKTDIIFAELFREFPPIFFEIIGEKDIDLQKYTFISPEIKQKAFRLDGVFLPTNENANKPIYFVEIQFYKDEEFYTRLFTGIFLYFNQERPNNSHWYAIVFYGRRKQETPIPIRYQALIEPHLRCIYLDEIEEIENESLGRGMMRLVVADEEKTAELGKKLIERAKVELKDELSSRQVIEFIETIVIGKFPLLSREEIEVMLNLNLLKETKVYQEAVAEGELKIKLATIDKLLKKGFSIQEIAELLELDIDLVREAIRG